MHLLQSGVDLTIIALWLGHELPATTHGYIKADLTIKGSLMSNLEPDHQNFSRFEASDELMNFLNIL